MQAKTSDREQTQASRYRWEQETTLFMRNVETAAAANVW